MHLSHTEFFKVPVENGLVRATDSAAATGKSVLEKRLDGLDQAITTRRSRLPTTDGIMGMTKMWDSSGIGPIELHLTKRI